MAALKQEAGEEVTITLIEGWRLEQMVGYLGTTKLTMNLDEFAALARTPPADLIAKYDFLAGLPAGHSLEGYLYPDTYRVDANATAREVIEKLLDTFGRRLTQEIRDGIAAQGLTIDQAVTLASIVEREAVLDAERPIIAGVYLNRINNPKAGTVGLLQADPTLQYGLATAEFGSRPVRDWHQIAWWPQLQTGGRRGGAARGAGRLPDLPGQGPPADADLRAADRLDRRGRRARHGQRLLLLRGRLPERRARRVALLRQDPRRAERQHRQGQRRVPRVVNGEPHD